MEVGFFELDAATAAPEWSQTPPDKQLESVETWRKTASDKLSAAPGATDEQKKQAATLINAKADKFATPLHDRVNARKALSIRDGDDAPTSALEAATRGQNPLAKYGDAINQFQESFRAEGAARQAAIDRGEKPETPGFFSTMLSSLSGAFGVVLGKGPEDAQRQAIRSQVSEQIGDLKSEDEVVEVFAKAREYAGKIRNGEPLGSTPEDKPWYKSVLQTMVPLANTDSRKSLAEAERHLQDLRELGAEGNVEEYKSRILEAIPFVKGDGIKVDPANKDELAKRIALTAAIQKEIEKNSVTHWARLAGDVVGTSIGAYGVGMASRLPGAAVRATSFVKTADVTDKLAMPVIYGLDQSLQDNIDRNPIERVVDIAAEALPIGIAERASEKYIGAALTQKLSSIRLTPAMQGLVHASAQTASEYGSELIEAGIRGDDITEAAKAALAPSAALGAGFGAAQPAKR
jgi:hypothetical protein